MKHVKNCLKLICLIICLLASGEVYSMPGSTITGEIKGLKDGSRILILNKRLEITDTIGLAIAKNERFAFKDLRFPIAAGLYSIRIQTEFVADLELFLAQDEHFKITGTLKAWPAVIVSGAKLYKEQLAYARLRAVANIQFDSLMAKDANAELMKENNRSARLAFIAEYPGSLYIPYLLYTGKNEYGHDLPVDFKQPIYDALPAAVKDSYYGKLVGKQLNDDAKNKVWIDKLTQSVVGLESITRTEAGEAMLANLDKKVLIPVLPIASKPLSLALLEEKLNNATVVLNMAYQSKDTTGTAKLFPNPTSAYVIDEGGICVSNYHVFKEFAGKTAYHSLSVMTIDGNVYPVVRVLSCSESDDLVVFQVDVKGDRLSALPLGNTAAKGAAIHVMGHPGGNFYQFTSGMVSGYSTSSLAGQPCNVMSITADFTIGSSGGPITDNYGNVVGTVSRIDGNGAKLGVPVSELKKLIEFKK